MNSANCKQKRLVENLRAACEGTSALPSPSSAVMTSVKDTVIQSYGENSLTLKRKCQSYICAHLARVPLGRVSSLERFLNCHTVDLLGPVILCGGDVLYIVGCLAASLASTKKMTVSTFPVL